MVRLFFAAAALALPLACSSSSTTSAIAGDTGEAGGDAGTPKLGDPGGGGGPSGPAGDAAVPGAPVACGTAPYVNVGLMVVSATTSGTNGNAIEGAKLTASICPGLVRYSDAAGKVTAQIAKGAALYGRFEAQNYAPTLVPEMKFDVDRTDLIVPLPPSLFVVLIPGFGADKTAIVIGLQHDGGMGACDELDAAQFDVPDHPDAKVTYFTADTPPAMSSGSTTTTAGRAVITGLAPGQLVTLRGSKNGCTVSFAKAPYTGRAPLEAGAVTLVPAFIH